MAGSHIETPSRYPTDVISLLDEFVAAVREELPDNLLGIYLRGSLALGDFRPDYSDVDLLVVTHQRVSDEEFEALRDMHERLRVLPNRYAAGLEAAYIDADSAKRFVPGKLHPTITSHDPFRWERLDIIQPPAPTGNFRFTTQTTDLPGTTGTGSSLASFLLGLPDRVERSLVMSPSYFRKSRAWISGRDSWALQRNLTLTERSNARIIPRHPSLEQSHEKR